MAGFFLPFPPIRADSTHALRCSRRKTAKKQPSWDPPRPRKTSPRFRLSRPPRSWGAGKVGENCGLMEMFPLGSVWLRRGNETRSDVDGEPPPPQPFSNLVPLFQNSRTAQRMHRRLPPPLRPVLVERASVMDPLITEGGPPPLGAP